ncbi:2-oxoglutarate and iron-dependent oxygenase domain-containing protein [Breoghania sp. L-A4]|uniref:isopenicillin N synthase family dioxygenase n=1 Tax=Breoghania sp. L-A4 TaxID=2304600 RepID=UPI000E358E5B|nr:2-oxoglutarate and iron-dependent oxygenase domain-containing protein [Breoghania sp. L-A4]AXS40929.1 isopenicillin N synthase family oxygenase [Breoghania sp. L-A4]
MSTDSLPIIDLAPLVSGQPAGTEHVARELGRAARETGFFYISGHGVDTALIDSVFKASHAFFAEPVETKMKLTEGFFASNRGYVPMKGESLDPTKPADLKEAYNIGLDLAADDPRILSGEPFRAVNQWPEIGGWRETMLAYFDVVWTLGRRLHRAIATDLGADPLFFEDKLDAPMATLRLLHYPPHPPVAEAGQAGAGTHTDYGNVTILLPDDVGGLEVQRRDGAWIKAPTVPGAFVCNIGDCLMRWTNDTYVSTPHRVVNASGRERYSVAFFLDPNPDATVACLPSCESAANPAKYPPVSAADYLKGRLDATYAAVKSAQG